MGLKKPEPKVGKFYLHLELTPVPPHPLHGMALDEAWFFIS
jgi:hypothetical protein